jgi:hypothetical protein
MVLCPNNITAANGFKIGNTTIVLPTANTSFVGSGSTVFSGAINNVSPGNTELITKLYFTANALSTSSTINNLAA